ncbi:phosphate ABC transporter permease PstA [Jonesia quinghaiensis]|uniref:phosphate ABC transporter permease PstA n=1 Tax=Jonesia quinghaiensis TaxID=262806 RepID=UPI0004274423|nr:phosphate ABC transporter permease PstA [Jonesia quinghaiensis]
MAATTPLEPSLAAPSGLLASRPRLPRWAVPSTIGFSFALSAVVLFLADSLTIPAVVALTVVLYAVAISVWSLRVEGTRYAADRTATTVVTAAFGIALIPLISLLWTVLQNGARVINFTFLNTNMVGVYGEMTEGGIYHAIWGTILITLAATAISVPIGILTAIYLVEYGRGALARGVTFFVDVMTGIPSIVAGLFAFSLFTLLFGPAFRAGIMGATALAVLMTPVVIRSVEEMLRLVPNELREASYALGVSKARTIFKVVLRTAIGGIVTGVMLAIARVIGETAPLLLTVGLAADMNWDLFEGRMATLPVFAYRQYQQGGIGVDRAWGAALTLIAIVMLLNIIARLIAKYYAPKASR